MYLYAVVIGALADPMRCCRHRRNHGGRDGDMAGDCADSGAERRVARGAPRGMAVIWLWVVADNGAMAVFNDLWKLPDSVLQLGSPWSIRLTC
jgi:hypothetical protein